MVFSTMLATVCWPVLSLFPLGFIRWLACLPHALSLTGLAVLGLTSCYCMFGFSLPVLVSGAVLDIYVFVLLSPTVLCIIGCHWPLAYLGYVDNYSNAGMCM